MTLNEYRKKLVEEHKRLVKAADIVARLGYGNLAKETLSCAETLNNALKWAKEIER